jgi:hypothetical protein
VWGSGCLDPPRWVVSFTPLPLYPRGKGPRRLGGSQSQSGRHAEVRILAIKRRATTKHSRSHTRKCVQYFWKIWHRFCICTHFPEMLSVLPSQSEVPMAATAHRLRAKRLPTPRRSTLLPSSGSEYDEASKSFVCLLLLLFYLEDGGSNFHRNLFQHLQDYTASYCGGQNFS